MKMKRKKIFPRNNQKGIAAIYLTLLILTVVFAMATTISVLTYNEQKLSLNIVKSNQAYYAAEAGLEDALLRLANDLNYLPSYNLTIQNSNTVIEISNAIGGVRTITSTGNNSDRIRKIHVVQAVSVDEISFYYGAQIGAGGMEMDNNTWVRGNVFSNGTVESKVPGAGSIEDSIIVAGNGNKIIGLNVGKDAQAHTCEDSVITGELTFVSGGAVQNCTAGSAVKERPNEILPKDLPISQAQIDEWKQNAQEGGILIGDYTIPGKDTQNLGPQKIEGNLSLENGALLNMEGIIWVTGNLILENDASITLDPDSYGPNSGMVVVDGVIDVKPGVSLTGSGNPESYLLLLSTNTSLDISNPAINIENNADAAIFYANQGAVTLGNNVNVREVAAYKLFLKNGTEITYESGLESASFTSGSGGSWKVVSWKEIE